MSEVMQARLEAVPEERRIAILQMLERHSSDWCRHAYEMRRAEEPNYSACAFCMQEAGHVHETVRYLEQMWKMNQGDYLS
jgi:hypothetical protein